jgi:hypothetical protein
MQISHQLAKCNATSIHTDFLKYISWLSNIYLTTWTVEGIKLHLSFPWNKCSGQPGACSSRLPLAQGPGKGPTTLDLMYATFPCISARDCLQDLNPWPHGHKATTLPLRQVSPSNKCRGSSQHVLAKVTTRNYHAGMHKMLSTTRLSWTLFWYFKKVTSACFTLPRWFFFSYFYDKINVETGKD